MRLGAHNLCFDIFSKVQFFLVKVRNDLFFGCLLQLQLFKGESVIFFLYFWKFPQYWGGGGGVTSPKVCAFLD